MALLYFFERCGFLSITLTLSATSIKHKFPPSDVQILRFVALRSVHSICSDIFRKVILDLLINDATVFGGVRVNLHTLLQLVLSNNVLIGHGHPFQFCNTSSIYNWII
ncbi:hypothetical protein RRF57_000097 [Xylaria bambusicola]|uniref:Uncharacterized protein n=1 Tax=Xylaria bambusicola TaxID=326684 RepID=A0AAN7Z5D2_9PEZI